MLALQARLHAHNQRLTITGADALNQRQKRRIMQKISKLKKQMSDLSGTPTSTSTAVGDKRTAPPTFADAARIHSCHDTETDTHEDEEKDSLWHEHVRVGFREGYDVLRDFGSQNE